MTAAGEKLDKIVEDAAYRSGTGVDIRTWIVRETLKVAADGIREYLAAHDIEGIVWHHPDGHMVKIKKRDFGFKR